MKETSANLLVLPGDGIGPEVVAAAIRVLDHLNTAADFSVKIETSLIGGASVNAHGVPLSPETLDIAKKSDAILLGAVGGPEWDDIAYDIRPEAGLLQLRKQLDLFANLRPAKVFDALVSASTLKPEIIKGLDILIVRELTGGVYFGTPRGIEDMPDGGRRGINTQVYTTPEIHRIARIAFELARKRNKKVCSCDKANVMESGLLWREEVTDLHKKEFSDIDLSHMYADNCAMQLLRAPNQFDVIVTDNLFGDMLSDEAAMLTGSLGLLPSASLGEKFALYEPVHGSAPDIAGKGLANPLATILSLSMLLRYSLHRGDLADKVEDAVATVLAKGLRTADLMEEGTVQLSTDEMATEVIKHTILN